MPAIARLDNGRFLRLCWCCLRDGVPAPAGSDPTPRRTPEEAAKTPGKCPDCHARSLAGLPVGRRIDA